MRYVWTPFILVFVGCATQRPVSVQVEQPAPPLLVAVADETKSVETRYELRSYREAANPALRHEPHAVYRRTRVPVTAKENSTPVSRTTYPPQIYTPLSPGDELAAELATQRKIAQILRAMHAAMAETEQRMQSQYATLIQQSAEVAKVREGLEAERSRIRAAQPANVVARPVPPRAPADDSPPTKW